MSDIPILTPVKVEKDAVDVLTEIFEQTQFLTGTLKKSEKSNKKQETSLKKIEEGKTKPTPKTKEDKETIKSNKKFSESVKDFGSQTKSFVEDTFLGDTSFITKPFDQMGTMFTSLGSMFGIKKKRKPTRSNMLKTNPEAVYIADTLLEGQEEGGFLDKLKGFLPMLLGGGAMAGLAKLGPMLMKAGAIGMIVGSLIWMAIDGFKAYSMAGEWGTSKLSAVIGGVLGGTGKGWKNAFKGMGKWALMGAGIGTLVAPGIGTLVGGLLGAAIGGILGFIGGEKIAKAMDKLGIWFKDVFWGGIKKAAFTLGNWFIELPGMLAEGFKEGWDQFKSEMGAVADFAKNLWSKISPIFTSIGDTVTQIFSSVIEGVKSFIDDPIGFGINLIKNIIDKVSSIFQDIKQGFIDFIDDPIGFVNDLIQPVKDFFNKIGDIFGSMFGWITGYETPEIDESFVSKAKSDSGYNAALGTPTVNPLSYLTRPVNDAILRPDGSIIETHPDDTIFASKNPIGLIDKSTQGNVSSIKDSRSENLLTSIKDILSSIANKPETIAGGGTVLQQNFVSRYTPHSIMNNLTTEVL